MPLQREGDWVGDNDDLDLGKRVSSLINGKDPCARVAYLLYHRRSHQQSWNQLGGELLLQILLGEKPHHRGRELLNL